MRAFVTGGTGLVGSHVVEALRAHGWAIRALARPASDTSHLRRLGVEIVPGDLERPLAGEALAGVDVVFHNAARVGDWGPARAFHELAVAGSERLFDAAARGGVRRVVHMSSAGVYGLRRIRGREVTEELSPRAYRWDSYGRAKIAAEAVARRHQAAGRVEVTVLRPTVVYGPRDRAVLPRLAGELRRGRLPLIGSGENRLHLIYAGDVAEAAVRAGTEPAAAGRTYHFDGPGDVTQRGFFEAIADLVGAAAPRRHIPLALAYGLAFALEIAGHATRRRTPPALTRYLVALAGGESRFDTTRARLELGFAPRTPFFEGM
jgi:nucleoside-diphosphate-sugar epimerase